jgi:MSHA pilin protein MshA
MKKQTGFTLIELVAVLVILALLGAMAVPRFASVQSDALRAAQDGSSNAVKSAHSIAIANLKRVPDVTELTGFVGGQASATAVAGGVQVTINSIDYVVPTYQDATCTAANVTTLAVGQSVLCVGTIP